MLDAPSIALVLIVALIQITKGDSATKPTRATPKRATDVFLSYFEAQAKTAK